eukprot:TRINITY_DN14671_c0_g1_i2.p2 TRINITY_DN14671_c0_g1~~TRINITY_DN14671_c0_g1_i2.p2  ORF type:complete len:56 (+),score=12.80 TRINITY_DN14671_c0_g1_i2:156-323(+)
MFQGNDKEKGDLHIVCAALILIGRKRLQYGQQGALQTLENAHSLASELKDVNDTK